MLKFSFKTIIKCLLAVGFIFTKLIKEICSSLPDAPKIPHVLFKGMGGSSGWMNTRLCSISTMCGVSPLFSKLANDCVVFHSENVGGEGGELPGQLNLDVFVCTLQYKQGISENYLMGYNVPP